MTHVVSHSTLEGQLPLDPLFPTPEDGWTLPDLLEGALFGPESAPEGCYAVLDAGQVPNLAQALEQSGLQHRCLFVGQTGEDLAEHAPWLVRLTPDARFTRDLLTQSDAPWHLWGTHRWIMVRSRGDFHALWKHFRRLTQITDAAGKRYYFRFWEAPYFRAALLQGGPENAAFFAPAPLITETLLPMGDGLDLIAVAPPQTPHGPFVLTDDLHRIFRDVALGVFYARLESQMCDDGRMSQPDFLSCLNGALSAGFRDRDVLEALMVWCADQRGPIFGTAWADASLAATAQLQDVSRFGQLRRAAARQAAATQ